MKLDASRRTSRRSTLARSVRELPAACATSIAASCGRYGMAEGARESTIRQARIDEAALLSEITWRALAYWGYDAAFMAWLLLRQGTAFARHAMATAVRRVGECQELQILAQKFLRRA